MDSNGTPEFNLNAICDCCEQQAQCADLGEELGMICRHCWSAARDLWRPEECGECHQPAVCFKTRNGWRCSHCLTSDDLPDERIGECERCGERHVLQRQPNGRWLCLCCRVCVPSELLLAKG